MRILVTGGAGYIGSHVLAVLAARGHDCISLDNYSNSSPLAIERVRSLVPGAKIAAYEVDLRDGPGVSALLRDHQVEAVIHLAGLKAVAESVAKPDLYYANNVEGTRVLLRELAKSTARTFVFSSSATVYGLAAESPIHESAPARPNNPYGETKLAVERLLAETARRDPTWRFVMLRYFNPAGAHPTGLIGESPLGPPCNLMPYICQVAAGQLEALRIFGTDYPTRDGTGERDYLHVMDLAEGHAAALDHAFAMAGGAMLTVNLGSGVGHTVLEVVDAFERANGIRIPRLVEARRQGDTAVCYADASLASRLLRWKVSRGLDQICRDAWNFQSRNPRGYRKDLSPAP